MNIKSLLASSFILASFVSTAQSDVAYAITGDGNRDFIWMNIRQIDLSTGKVTKSIFQHNASGYVLTDASTKKSVDQTAIINGNTYGSKDYPTATFVAASAYDNRSGRLYFLPMRVPELRWIETDIKNEVPRFFTLSSKALELKAADESGQFTRMVIAADGYGYALSNDANHLVKFSTSKKPVITDLGALIDAEGNNTVSIHNKCTSWGGDMIADAFGKLIVISANHSVFEVDINSRVATYKGNISGLPAAFTTNGAAVDRNGDIIVASANTFEGYYKLNISDLAAVKIEGSDTKYNASDLANGNLLRQKEADAASKFSLSSAPVINEIVHSENRVFPNPVTASTFNVIFDGRKEGSYTITLSDVAGRSIQSKKVNINKGSQTEKVNITNRPSKGLYLVKITDEAKQVIFTEKIMIQ